MNQVKSRLAALALLDRAMASVSDERLDELVASFDDEFRSAYDRVVGWSGDEEQSIVEVTRAACHSGRMNGTLERVAALVSDRCLAQCIELLGEAADDPTEEQLLSVTPRLAEDHGVDVVRLMLASAVAGEAAAAVVCTRLLKHDADLALPSAPPPAPRPAPELVDETERAALRDRRKQERQRKQADQKLRREQAAAAKGRRG